MNKLSLTFTLYHHSPQPHWRVTGAVNSAIYDAVDRREVHQHTVVLVLRMKSTIVYTHTHSSREVFIQLDDSTQTSGRTRTHKTLRHTLLGLHAHLHGQFQRLWFVHYL